jgi:hypothetical protein
MTAALNLEDPSPLDSLLGAIAETLDVPQSAYDDATARYTAVGEWLCRDGSSLLSQEPNVYPQGSFAIGTATIPLKGDDYDLDAVVQLAGPKTEWRPAELKTAVGNELKASGVYAPMLEDEGRRCWTLRYSSKNAARGFHMDLLPSVPLFAQDGPTAIAITNRLPTGLVEWRESDPKSYAAWFRRQMQPLRERRLRTDKIAGIEAVPFFETRVPLQYVVQLLKRYRDVLFQGDPEIAPISIIITTLAALAYRGEETITECLYGVLDRMPDFVEHRGGLITIPNPVQPNENFADRWQGDVRKQRAFLRWLDAAGRLGQALQSASREQLGPLLEGVLGKKSTRVTLAKFDARQADADARSVIRPYPSPDSSVTGIIRRAGSFVANLPRLLLEAKHRDHPPWPMRFDGRQLTVRGTLVDSRGALIGGLSSGERVNVGANLRFDASCSPSDGKLFWQVTNTGAEALRANDLRGKFEDTPGTKRETARYRGTHFVACFLVRDDVCVARSEPFTVSIE